MNSLPLSVLENVLHPKQISFDENYLIELNNGELVTLGDLTNFWIEGHRKIQNALDIIKETRNKVEREPKEKTKLSSEQEMEGVPPSDECKSKGTGPDNSKETVQGSKPTPQEPQRRRIRKSDKSK